MSDALASAMRYAAAGLCIFPVSAAKRPLVAHWRDDASSDFTVVESWLKKWPHADLAWAVPAPVVVIDIDIDVTRGKRGYDDFKRLAGCDARDVATPGSSTPSGGRHIFFAATKSYKNAVAIAGASVDLRALGGYVVLPSPGNGRQWLRPLIGADGAMMQMASAPAWLDVALRPASPARAPLVLAPRAAFSPAPSSDPWTQKKALVQLAQACARIAAAPCGAQDSTRHAQCYYVGGLVGRGDIDYASAYAALLEAALAMPAHTTPWLGLETKVARSIESGMTAPLHLAENESWVREFRARLRLRLAGLTGASRE